MREKKLKISQGFTLVELLVYMVLLGLLLSCVYGVAIACLKASKTQETFISLNQEALKIMEKFRNDISVSNFPAIKTYYRSPDGSISNVGDSASNIVAIVFPSPRIEDSGSPNFGKINHLQDGVDKRGTPVWKIGWRYWIEYYLVENKDLPKFHNPETGNDEPVYNLYRTYIDSGSDVFEPSKATVKPLFDSAADVHKKLLSSNVCKFDAETNTVKVGFGGSKIDTNTVFLELTVQNQVLSDKINLLTIRGMFAPRNFVTYIDK